MMAGVFLFARWSQHKAVLDSAASFENLGIVGGFIAFAYHFCRTEFEFWWKRCGACPLDAFEEYRNMLGQKHSRVKKIRTSRHRNRILGSYIASHLPHIFLWRFLRRILATYVRPKRLVGQLNARG